MNPEFDLVYVRKSDNAIFNVRRVVPGHYSIVKAFSMEKPKPITRAKLIKEYEYQSRISNEAVRKRSQPMVSKSA